MKMKNKIFKLGQQVGERFDFEKEEVFLANLEKYNINDKILYLNKILEKLELGFPESLIITEENKEKIIKEFIDGFRSIEKEL
jgi:hypothetical protein